MSLPMKIHSTIIEDNYANMTRLEAILNFQVLNNDERKKFKKEGNICLLKDDGALNKLTNNRHCATEKKCC